MNRSIIIGGKEVTVGCPVITYLEPNGYSFYKNPPRFNPHNENYDELQNRIQHFVVHHSVTYTAKETYTGLISRGLSVNFIIDDDCDEDGLATIYQCLDVKDGGWSQKPYNNLGPGVEICYHPEAWKNVDLYSDSKVKNNKIQKHDIVTDVIHGQKLKCFKPTQAQVGSLILLLAAFCHAFPKIKPEFPKKENEYIKTVVNDLDKYFGLLNHYNITREKIDAIGLDLAAIEQAVQQLVSLKV